MSQAVQDLQNAQNQSQIMRAQGAIAAIQAAQRASQDAVQNAINAEIDVALEEQAMNEQADEAAYQEAAKTYLAAQAKWYNDQVQSLERLGTPDINIPQPNAPIQNNGAQYRRVGIVPSTAPL
jgi:hypothetical protein